MKSMTITQAMDIAYAMASASYCHDKQVGCVLLNINSVFLSAGYNISCGASKCLKEQDKECTATHAEVAALEYLNAQNHPYIAVCTLEPCLECAKKLYTAGVRVIYFHEKTSQQKRGTAWFENQSTTRVIQIRYKNKMAYDIASLLFSNSLKSVIDFIQADFERVPNWASLFNDIRQYHKDLKYPEEFFRSEQSICVLQKQQIRAMVLALVDEAHEALHEVDWKPWKNYNGQPKINVEKFLEETGDILFFIDGMLMTFGLSWDDLMQAVAQKLKVVRDRMATGYHN